MPVASRFTAVSSGIQGKRPGALLLTGFFFVLFAAIAISHATLLHLPYFWDEGGYYVPAALDFYHTGTLIPVFTNAHPPLPNVVLGSLWHVFGLHILVTRLAACLFAAAGLTATFALAALLLGTWPALAVTLLTALYPVWFAQSSLAHADIFAAAFSLGGLALTLTSPELIHFIGNSGENFSSRRRIFFAALLFCLSVLAKETAIVQPAALLAGAALLALLQRHRPGAVRNSLRWALALLIPFAVLAAWYAFHFAKTGFIFGNPEFLRYNATANLTPQHVFYAFRIRCVHLFWQRDLWLPLTMAAACMLLPSRSPGRLLGLPRAVTWAIALLVLANLVAFSFLGGALLTRYLLPIYPLLLLLYVAVWADRTELWAFLAGITAAAFLSALWLNPFAFFAPEDNLTYRDMIVAQQGAAAFLNTHFPDATVLTAWPVSADLTRPELGYSPRTFRVLQIDNFSPEQLAKAAAEPGKYDTAVVFATHYTSPAFRRFLLTHPKSWRGRRYAAEIDLDPTQIARILGGSVVWQTDQNGEWAAVIRFKRSYDARLEPAFVPSASRAFR